MRRTNTASGFSPRCFPVTDELNDVGGFKFPRSKAHLREIDDYITAVVSHFRQYESLWTWVLQNEPGSGGTRVAMTDLAREVYDRWLADFPPEERGGGLSESRFHAGEVPDLLYDVVSEPYRAAGRTARSAARATYQSAPDSGHAARLRLSGLLEIPHLGRRIAAPELAFRHVQPARISARRLP